MGMTQLRIKPSLPCFVGERFNHKGHEAGVCDKEVQIKRNDTINDVIYRNLRRIAASINCFERIFAPVAFYYIILIKFNL